MRARQSTYIKSYAERTPYLLPKSRFYFKNSNFINDLFLNAFTACGCSTEGLTGDASQAWQGNHNSVENVMSYWVWCLCLTEGRDICAPWGMPEPSLVLYHCIPCAGQGVRILKAVCPLSRDVHKRLIVCCKPKGETHMNAPITHLNLIWMFVTSFDPPVNCWLILVSFSNVYQYWCNILFYPGMEDNLPKINVLYVIR